MIYYGFKQQQDGQIHLSVWLCGVMMYETTRCPPWDCENPITHYDTEASRATLLEAAQPTIDRLQEYFA